MPDASYALPLSRDDQHRVALQWQAAAADPAAPLLAGGLTLQGVRAVVRESWRRATLARVNPALASAPVALDEDALDQARAAAAWLPVALGALTAQRGAYAAGGSVVTFFDASGRMLHAEGEARALDGLADINFRPGSVWAEDVVGTNGPGTALALQQPVHIVGAEHYCEQWHGWHCAAVPLRDPLSREVIGALDLSGFRRTAHPHTLMLVMALAAAIEQMLAGREAERRNRLLEQFAAFASRWPGEALVAIDRTGTILSAAPAAPAALHPLAPLPDAVRAALAAAVASASSDAPRTVTLPAMLHGDVVMHPVLHHGIIAGACLIIPKATPAPRARSTAGGTQSAARYTLDEVVGDAPALQAAHRVAIAAAANTLPVLLLGESGTGKELFAQGIHAASARAGRPFIAVNCAALPAELVESELFGYVGGAFSGARREGAVGKFEAAHGGTILLDEIGDLPLPAQAALLRVLQEGEVTRVGATRGVRVDVRVIAATNGDIDAARRQGTFRDDLYYRLGVLTITLPPLRERRTDIGRLAARFLAEAGTELGRTGQRFAPATLDALRAHDWPGNIRELKNLIWRIVALTHDRVITPDALPSHVTAASAAVQEEPHAKPSTGSGADPERERVIRAVEQSASMGEAAQVLGIARSTLYRQLERYGLAARRVVRR